MNEKQSSLSGQTGTSTTANGGLAAPQTAGAVAGASKAIAQDAKHVASEVAGQAKQQVASRIEDQKDKAAQGLSSVATAIRQTGESLRDRDQLGVTQYVDGMADQIERLSDYVMSSNVGQMVGEVETFARREPAIFLGSAFLLGLVGARFLKASSPGYSLKESAYDDIRDEPRAARGGYPQGDDRLSYGGVYARREGVRTQPQYATNVDRERTSAGGTYGSGASTGGTYGTGASPGGTYGTGTSTGGTYGTSSGTSTGGTYGSGTSSASSGYGTSSGTPGSGASTSGTYGSGSGVSTGGTYGTGTGTGTSGTYGTGTGTGTSTGGTYGTGTGTSTGGTYGSGTGTSTGGTYGSGTGAVGNTGPGTSSATSTPSIGSGVGTGSAAGTGLASTSGAAAIEGDVKSGSTLPGTGKVSPEPGGKGTGSTGKS